MSKRTLKKKKKFFSENRASIGLAKRSVPPLVLILGSLRCHNSDGNENVKRAIHVDQQNNNFACASRSFVHFFTVAARLLMNKPFFAFYGGRIQVMVVRNLNPEEFACIWQSKGIWKIAIEFERTQIQHFHGRHCILNLLLFFGRKERKLVTNKHIKQHCLTTLSLQIALFWPFHLSPGIVWQRGRGQR